MDKIKLPQGIAKTKYAWRASYQNKEKLSKRLNKNFKTLDEAIKQRKTWETKYGTVVSKIPSHHHGVNHTGQKKDYIGESVGDFKVVASTGEVDSTGNQIVLISDGNRYAAVSVNKFMNGWIPLSPQDRRKSYVKRKNSKPKKIGNKYIVSITRNSRARVRTFNSEQEAINFLDAANELYIKQGKTVDKHIPLRVSKYVFERESPWGTEYVFDRRIDGKRYSKGFKSKAKALAFEKRFSKTPETKRKQLMILGYSSSNYKYIHQGRSSFYFEKTISGQRVRKGFNSLKSALDFRDAFLREHNLTIPLDRSEVVNEQH